MNSLNIVTSIVGRSILHQMEHFKLNHTFVNSQHVKQPSFILILLSSSISIISTFHLISFTSFQGSIVSSLIITHNGCYGDGPTRDLPYHRMQMNGQMTVEICISHCVSHSKKYAGLQVKCDIREIDLYIVMI